MFLSWGARLARRSATEAPLSKSPKQASVNTQSPSSSFNTPLLAAVPSHYSSLESCERTTHNCTTHGTCVKLYSEKDGDRTSDTYGCVCDKPSIRKNKDGSEKTTYYGGTACQKVDVSGPFWLLAGTSLVLVTILSLGLGMLYSVGYEELPSVIGAGVTGPRPK
jgi:hypothetical protein